MFAVSAQRQKPQPSRRLRFAFVILVALIVSVACNRHVFRVVPADCVKEQQVERALAADVPADILVVVDNSGSMCEEQDNLVENFFDPDCPVDVSQPIPNEYINPTPDVVAQLAQNCGFIQILSLFEKDFRLGVITTDVGQCDNRFNLAGLADAACDGTAYPDWGRKPQRGCLQPTSDGQKIISNTDVATGDIGTKFRSVLANIRTFGSPFERGLDAVEIFLDPESERAPGCSGDLDRFLRPEAKLIVIFLSDEEDCSHADGAYGFVDENQALGGDGFAASTCSPESETYFSNRDPIADPQECYAAFDKLAPIDRYVDFLRAKKGDDVAVAVIAGAVEANASLEPAGCRIANGSPSGMCTPTLGQFCDSQSLQQQGLPPCCEADSGSRYFQFARAFGAGSYLENSICYDSFRSTMIDIASFIGREEFVRLEEVPVDPDAIVVRVRRAGSEETENLPRIPDGEDPDGQDGWQYDGNLEINFYGSAVPQPGDNIYVAALDNRGADGAACVAPDFDDAAVDAGP